MTEDREMDNREFCSEMLAKLERPLSFIGERRQNYIVFDGKWTDIKVIVQQASNDPSFKSSAKSKIIARLDQIKEDLRCENVTKSEAEDLYEEGIALRRTLYLLDRRSMEVDEDRHGDTRRWIKYGRSISP